MQPRSGASGEAPQSVLLVDDDETVREVVRTYLESAGFEVRECSDGASALAALSSEGFSLVILDLMLPGLDGLEVFRRMRGRGITTPVIMLTAKRDEADRILGLEMGADDYVSKPFSPRELVLRARMVLRRTAAGEEPTAAPRIVGDGALRVDAGARRAFFGERELALTLREFDLLCFLMSRPDTLFTRDELMQAVWGWEFGDPSTVTVHVRRVRAKLAEAGADPERLATVWGRGYRWTPEAGAQDHG